MRRHDVAPGRSVKATFLVPYPLGVVGGQRMRFEQWLSLLPPGAVDADIRPLFSPSAYRILYEPGHTVRKGVDAALALGRRVADAVAARRSDVVFLYREAFPLGPPLVEALLERRVPVVYDFDDAIFLGDTSAANRLAARLKPRGKVGRVVQGAAATTVGNDYLASFARRFSDSVHVLPTTVDVEEFVPRPRSRRQDGTVRIGWNGSRTTSPHLLGIAGALRRVLRELPVELVVVGDQHFRLEGASRVTAKPFRAEAEVDEVSAFDIGLMPLPSDEWSLGKCGGKALVYMGLGVPAVVSPVGVNTDLVRDGEYGLWASTEDDWVEAIGRLVEDPGLRERLGAAGRETIVERYSGQRWAPRFLEVLEEAASRPR